MTECRYCAEAIDPDAELCPHCGEYLAERPTTVRSSSRSVIIVILVAVACALGGCVAFGVMGYLRAQTAQKQYLAAKSQAENAMLAERVAAEVRAHAAKTGALPVALSDVEGMAQLADDSAALLYFEKACDAWATPFGYETTGDGFDLTSYGADQAPGGTGDDADVTTHHVWSSGE